MTKVKICPFCEKQVLGFWKAKTRDRDPCCKQCLPLYNQKYEKTKNTKTSSSSGETESKSVSGQVRYSSIKQKPITQFSAKHIKKLAEYRPLRDAYLKEHPYCEIKSPKCTGLTTELHHKKPRRYYLTDVSVFCASCRSCNSYVESHHEWARERGFKIDHL